LRHDAARTLIPAVAWAIFGLVSVTPIVWMLGSAQGGSFPLAAGVLVDSRQRALLGHTLQLGAGVTAFAFIIGAPAGIALARCSARRLWLVRLVLSVPLVLPSYVLALAWTVLFGSRTPSLGHGMPAAIGVLGCALFPIVMLATEAAVRAVPTRFEEAACLTASPGRVFLRITAPLAAAAVTASLMIVFVLAISDFAVPGMLRVRVYTTEVFTAFAALYDFGSATIMALPLVLVAAIASIGALALSRSPVTARVDRSPVALQWTRSAQRTAVFALALMAFLVVGVPVGALAVTARSAASWRGDAVSVAAIRNSVAWSAAGASLVVLIGSVLGYSRGRDISRHGRAADALWVTLFAVPATVVGIGIITIWNRPGLAGTIYRSDAGVVAAYLTRFLPVGALLCGAFIRRIAPGAEEAAMVAGASWTTTFSRIIVPLSRGGLTAVWLMMFILMFGDVALTILVSPPGESNLAVRAYTLIANSPAADVAQLALVQIAVTLVPLLFIALVARRQAPA
jgi:iron(III) transport system permease protein